MVDVDRVDGAEAMSEATERIARVPRSVAFASCGRRGRGALGSRGVKTTERGRVFAISLRLAGRLER